MRFLVRIHYGGYFTLGCKALDVQTLTFANRLRGLWGGQGTLRQQLAQAAAGSAALALSSKLLMLLTSVLLARWMGVEGYGVYATAMALVLLLTVPTGLGLPTLVIRLLASYRVYQQWGLMRGLLVRGNQAVLGASLAMALIAAAAIWWLEDRLGLVYTAVYVLALVLIPLTALGAMRSAALRGLHHVILGQLPESLVMPALFLALVVGWRLALGGSAALSPELAILARIVATAAAFGVGAALLLRRIPGAMRRAAPEYQPRAWARAALPLLFIAGINIVNMQTDILMLAALRGSASAGVYQAAVRGAELVAFALVIVNMAIQPSLARLHAAGDKARLQRLVTWSARGATAVALPLAAVMILWGKPIMAAVFGADFARGAIALAILSAAQLINAFTGPANSLLDMTGHQNDTLKAMMSGVLANVALNALLIPRWDIAGAAIATGTSLILWNVLLMVFVQRRLGMDATTFGLGRIDLFDRGKAKT
jgi:O-antigen/teichoic acid export membrane protein